ncbi:PBSX family phage terminase large subunit [Kineococcus gypseus]|uniref:PBSX family phage terminase large subunit n=1 Tax=Kineococcus gypseus TaxID=1637102 RepID=UPI003D7E4910
MDLPLSPKQAQSIVQAREHRLCIWSGAVRSGKTISSLVAFLDAIARAPRTGLVLITGRTLQTIERNILEPLMDPDVFGELARLVKHTRGASIATILGREVHLIGAADARAEGKLRGLTACLALVDEATLLPEEFFMQLLARLSVTGSQLFATTNPGSPQHWLKQKFLNQAAAKNVRAWHFTLDDNPGLDPGIVQAIKTEHTGLFYRRNVLGEWVAAEGAVYESWDPERHVVAWELLPPMARLLSVGIDYGTTNPTSAVLLGLGEDQRLYLVDEWRYDPAVAQRRLTDAQISQRLRAWLTEPHLPATLGRAEPRIEWVLVDPAAASFKVQLHSDGVRSVQDAENQVAYGIGVVASLLAAGQLLVSDRCTGFVDEVAGYSWDPKATEKGEDKPLKVADHSLDAARYAVTTTETLWRGSILPPQELNLAA